MKIDIKRVAASALEAALNEEPEPTHRRRGVRTLAAGAALVTAARLGEKHLPRLTELRLVGQGLAKLEDMADIGNLADTVRGRLADYVHDDDADEIADDAGAEDEDEQDYEESQPEAESGDDEEGEEDDEEDSQPEAEGGEDEESPQAESGDEGGEEDDEEDSQPEAESGEGDEEDSQPEAETGEDEEGAERPGRDAGPDGDTPDLVDALSGPQSRPPVMQRMAEDLDPAAHAPEAVERLTNGRHTRSRDGARSSSNRKKQSTAG